MLMSKDVEKILVKVLTGALMHKSDLDLEGYALIEYKSVEAAQAAISGMNGAGFFSQTICVD